MAEDFFTAFETALRPAEAAGLTPAPAAAAPKGNNVVWWVVGAAVVLAALYFLMR